MPKLGVKLPVLPKYCLHKPSGWLQHIHLVLEKHLSRLYGRTSARETEPVKLVPEATVDATLPHLPQVLADMVRFQRLTGRRPKGRIAKQGDFKAKYGVADVVVDSEAASLPD